MGSYEFLAGCYDELTYDVGYPAWADYIEAHFRKKGPYSFWGRFQTFF